MIVYAQDTTAPVCDLSFATANSCKQYLSGYSAKLRGAGAGIATDNCTPIATIYQTPVPGNILSPQSTFPITITAIDTFGNIGTCTFTVTTIDTFTTAPTILCGQPATTTLYLDAFWCERTMPDYRSLVTANDNCSNSPAPSITQLPIPGTTLSGAGTQLVVMTATDNNNNSSTCSYSITLVDTVAPSMVTISYTEATHHSVVPMQTVSLQSLILLIVQQLPITATRLLFISCQSLVRRFRWVIQPSGFLPQTMEEIQIHAALFLPWPILPEAGYYLSFGYSCCSRYCMYCLAG
ncbi:MAG: hypothetical protein R3B47_06930 [Bacteroidia bacterium]